MMLESTKNEAIMMAMKTTVFMTRRLLSFAATASSSGTCAASADWFEMSAK